MRILVDADACPVKGIIENTASRYGVKLILVANTNHNIESSWGEVITVDDVPQAADITLVNLVLPGDIIVTQDYGLAAMILGKKAAAISPAGMIYTPENIDGLLMQRYISFKARAAGEKTRGPNKRTAVDNIRFEKQLNMLVENSLNKK